MIPFFFLCILVFSFPLPSYPPGHYSHKNLFITKIKGENIRKHKSPHLNFSIITLTAEEKHTRYVRGHFERASATLEFKIPIGIWEHSNSYLTKIKNKEPYWTRNLFLFEICTCINLFHIHMTEHI